MKTIKKTILGLIMMAVALVTTNNLNAQDAPQLSDAEIASIAVIANQNDIDFAKLAMKKSKNKKVIEFAETMIEDHQTIIDLAVNLVTKLGVTPQENQVGKQY